MIAKKRILQLLLRDSDNIALLGDAIRLGLPLDEFDFYSAYLSGKRSKDDEKTIYFEFTKKELKGRRVNLARRLFAFCKEHQIDIVIAHRFKAIETVLKVNRKYRFEKIIAVTHGAGDYKRLFRRFYIRRLIADNFVGVGVSDYVRDDLIASKAGFTSENTVAIPNAIDIQMIKETLLTRFAARKHLVLKEDAFIFGTIGRLSSVKWHNGLIDAFYQIAKDYPSCQLCIIGDGPLYESLRLKIDNLSLNDSVVLIGNQDRASRYLSAFDTFVLPSLSEGLSIALLEAMASSLPIIGSDIPSIASVIEDHTALFDKGSHESLASLMKVFLEMSVSDRLARGKVLYDKAAKYYDVSIYQKRYYHLIRGCSV